VSHDWGGHLQDHQDVGWPVKIAEGTALVVRDARNEEHAAVALSGVHRGHKFPHVHIEMASGPSVWPANDCALAEPVPETCHCGRSVHVYDDLGGFTRNMCHECSTVRCDTSDGMPCPVEPSPDPAASS
jgi:hypothetical protein